MYRLIYSPSVLSVYKWFNFEAKGCHSYSFKEPDITKSQPLLDEDNDWVWKSVWLQVGRLLRKLWFSNQSTFNDDLFYK